METKALAARPAPGESIGPTDAQLPPMLWDSSESSHGRVVRLEATDGRVVFAVAQSSGGAEGDRRDLPLVRLGRLLWAQLGVKPGSILTADFVTPPAASRVELAPPIVLSPSVERKVAEIVRERALPVSLGARLWVPNVSGDRGVVVRVHGADPAPAVAHHSTEVVFAEAEVRARPVPSVADVGGLDDLVKRIHELVVTPLESPVLYRSFGISPPRGILLHGPSGTGKTLVGRVVAEQVRDRGIRVFTMAATELIGSYSGETEANLRGLFADAINQSPSLIVLDEVDVLLTTRDSLASQSDIRAASQLLALMDGLDAAEGVMVLGTTNRLDVVDPAYRRPGRFDEEMFVGPPDAASRRDILAVHTRDMPLTPEAESALHHEAETRTAAFTGADLMAVSREIGLAALGRLNLLSEAENYLTAGASVSATVEDADVQVAFDRVSASLLRSLRLATPSISWEDVVGLDEIKAVLESAARLCFGASAGNREGVLITGPTGNGKTVVVRALAQHMRLPLIELDPAVVFTKWLGESESAVVSHFRSASSSRPSILVLEHLDAIVPTRAASERERADDRVLAALLSSIDQAIAVGGILPIGITAHPERVDPAVLRRGRLGLHLEIGIPSEARRRAVAVQVMEGSGADTAAAQVEQLVQESEGCSVAEVQRRALEQSEAFAGKAQTK